MQKMQKMQKMKQLMITGSSRGTSGRSLGGSTSQGSEGEGGQMMMGINMADWDTGPHREMAVDVPDSFVARTKTPPRYPPPKQDVPTSPGALRKRATVSSASAAASSSSSAPSNGVGKPTLPSREHLRIEEDGRLVNRAVPPQVHLICISFASHLHIPLLSQRCPWTCSFAYFRELRPISHSRNSHVSWFKMIKQKNQIIQKYKNY